MSDMHIEEKPWPPLKKQSVPGSRHTTGDSPGLRWAEETVKLEM